MILLVHFNMPLESCAVHRIENASQSGANIYIIAIEVKVVSMLSKYNQQLKFMPATLQAAISNGKKKHR